MVSEWCETDFVHSMTNTTRLGPGSRPALPDCLLAACCAASFRRLAWPEGTTWSTSPWRISSLPWKPWPRTSGKAEKQTGPQSRGEFEGTVLGVVSFSILFNHRSFRKPDPFSLGFWRFSRKKDAWKECGRHRQNCGNKYVKRNIGSNNISFL